MKTKVCPGCPEKGPLPRTAEFFGKDKGAVDGMRYKCRKCETAESLSRRSKRAIKNTPSVVSRDLNTTPGWPNLRAFDAGASFDAAPLEVSPAMAHREKIEASVEELTAPRIEIVEETITQVEEHRLKRRIKSLEAENATLVEQLSDGGEFHEIIQEVLAHQGETEAVIEPRERESRLAEATPLVLASDWHIEEEVLPEQVAGRNRYNLEIAARRMERFFEASMWAVRHQREVFKIRDMIGWWGGDFITNFLHPDNIETNQLHPTEAIMFAETNIIKGIDYWLEDPEIEQFLFPCNDGNHGRLTKKMQSATRTQNSLEVFLYAQLALHYKNEPRVKFILPTSSYTFVDNVYGKTIRFLHGDTFRYSGGVGGITIPLMKALAKWETVKRANLTCMGHWHQRINLPNLMVNGSLIGYNSYAMDIAASFEPPVQSLRMLEPKRWCSSDIPLWVSERGDDDMNTL